MIAKKKSKPAKGASKPKKAAAKKAGKKSLSRSTAKKSAVKASTVITKKKTAPAAKQQGKNTATKRADAEAAFNRADILSHGDDLHLIPVQGEINPASAKDRNRVEKFFKHNEETALHQEQQKIKSVVANNKFAKRAFLRPRQS